MTDITIREAKLEDFDKFYPFFKKNISEQFAIDYTPLALDYIVEVVDSKSVIRRNLKNNIYFLFLALHKKNVVGFVLTRNVFAGVSMAQWVAVHPNFHKQGIASKLLNLWAKTAQNKGAHALLLWTGDRNVVFYKNRGFMLGGRFPHAWYGLDINLFYKPLRSPDEKNYLKDYIAKRKKLKIKS